MQDLAPIVLFVYNRPWHTRQTLEALSKNILADKSNLFIYADGPKENATEEQITKIKEVRQIIREKKWCKEIEIIEREKNLGLANSVISGVTEIVNKFLKIIVLEDDLITSKYFLKFMNDGLEFYKDEEKVISIHGYVYPVKKKLPETFFLKGADCWGWATWKRGWSLFENDAKKLLDEIILKKLHTEFDFNGSYPFTKMLKAQVENNIDSWGIKWYASAFLNHKFTLYPCVSFIQNIGHDNSGRHSGKTNKFFSTLAKDPVTIKSIPVEINQEAFTSFQKYFLSHQPGILARFIDKISRMNFIQLELL